MAQYVKLPDGSYASFPDDMSDDEIGKALSSSNTSTKGNLIESLKKATGTVISDVAAPFKGAAQTAANVGEFVFNLPTYAGLPIQKVNLTQYLPFETDPSKLSTKENILRAIPQLAGAAAVPEANLGKLSEVVKSLPGLGKYLAPALEMALPQAAYSGITAPEGSRQKEAITSGLIAAPFGALSEPIGKLGKLASFLSPKDRALKAVQTAVGETGGATPVLEAAQRQGIPFVTPGEATGYRFQEGIESQLGRTPEVSRQLDKAELAREAALGQSIEKLKSNIYNPSELDALKNNLYKEVNNVLVPEGKIEKLYDNDIFKSVMGTLKNTPDFTQATKGLPENSIGYLDKVKQYLGNKQFTRENKLFGQKGIDNIRKDLINVLDEASPKYLDSAGNPKSIYGQARGLAERDIARSNLEDAFNSKPMNAENFSKYLQNKETYNELKGHLRDIPEAQSQLDDLKTITDKLNQFKINQAASREGREVLKGPGLEKVSDIWNKPISKTFNKIWGNRYDKAMADLITNPNWANELKNISKINQKEKLASSLVNLIGKAGSQSAAQEGNKNDRP